MKKILKYTAMTTVVCFSLGAGSAANANVLDIPYFIDVDTVDGGVVDGGFGEKAVADGTIVTIDGLKLAVAGANSDGSTTTNGAGNVSGDGPFAYFDENTAGLGVCQTLYSNNTCNPSSDDNVTGTSDDSSFDEVLKLDFSPEEANTSIDIQQLYFRNSVHGTAYPADSYIDVSVNGDPYVRYTLGTANIPYVANQEGSIGQVLLVDENGDAWTEITSVQTLMLRFNNAQFYLSGMLWEQGQKIEPVPLPAGLILMLSGLFGLGFLGRYRAKLA